jgi:hypothetical protein
MVRAAKPGGRLVCCEPDWSTLVIDALDRRTTRALLDPRAERLRHGWIGRRRFGLFEATGLVDVVVEFIPSPLTDFRSADRAFQSRLSADGPARILACPYVTADAVSALVADLHQDPILSTTPVLSGRLPRDHVLGRGGQWSLRGDSMAQPYTPAGVQLLEVLRDPSHQRGGYWSGAVADAASRLLPSLCWMLDG